jgi:hypothetical protein
VDDGQQADGPGVGRSVDQLLVTRTGELWAHAIDVCQATGRPLPLLDLERMAMLCDELMAAVPLAPQDQVAEPDVTVVADAVDLCRVAVRRLRPDQLDASIDGDHSLGELVLRSIDALARD